MDSHSNLIRPFVKCLAALSFLSLTACIETTDPLCSDANRVDVPGFARQYRLSLLFDPAQDMKDSSINIIHVGVGRYKTETGLRAGNEVSTCQVGRWTLAESSTDYGTYQQQILSIGRNNGTASMSSLLANRHALDKAGVSYQIVERTTRSSGWGKFLQLQNEEKHNVMVIRADSTAAKEALEKLAVPSGIGMLMY
jgi:hypothetical protein